MIFLVVWLCIIFSKIRILLLWVMFISFFNLLGVLYWLKYKRNILWNYSCIILYVFGLDNKGRVFIDGYIVLG